MSNERQFDFKSPIVEFNEDYLEVINKIKELENYGKYYSNDIVASNGKLSSFSEYGSPIPLLDNEYFNNETKDFQSDLFLDFSEDKKEVNELLSEFNLTIDGEFTLAKVFCPYTGELMKEFKSNKLRQRDSMKEIRVLDRRSQAYSYIDFSTIGNLNSSHLSEEVILNEFSTKPLSEIYGTPFFNEAQKHWSNAPLDYRDLDVDKIIFDGVSFVHFFSHQTKEISLKKVHLKDGCRYIPTLNQIKLNSPYFEYKN